MSCERRSGRPRGERRAGGCFDRAGEPDGVILGAVDQHGRVVASLGYVQASGNEDFELGGYPIVADALHGYVRE